MSTTCRLSHRAVALALATAPALAQNTWYVDDDGVPPGSGTPQDPYTSIQYAMDQPSIVTGDILLVAPGLYSEAVRFGGKGVRVIGDPSDRPVVSAVGLNLPTVTCADGEPFDEPPRLENLVLQGGTGALVDGWGNTAGGGVYVASSSLSAYNCDMGDNTADYGGSVYCVDGEISIEACSFIVECPFGPCSDDTGGAIYAEDSSVRIEHSDFSGYYTDYGAGAIFCSGCFIRAEGSLFRGCKAWRNGGAMSVATSILEVSSCIFEGNRSSDYAGGAIAMYDVDAAIEDTVFTCNESDTGGAIVAQMSSVALSRCVFSHNSCRTNNAYQSGNGGAINVDDGGTGAKCLVADTVFSWNTANGNLNADVGHGGACFGPMELERCTLLGNAALDYHGGAGIGGATYGALLIHDSVVWHNSPESTDPWPVYRYSDVDGAASGEGNIDADPLFVSAPDDLHLRHASPCIDAGDPASERDEDGTRADMGAFPYTWADVGAKYCSTHVNSSGLPACARALGSATVEDNWLRLTATDVARNQFGYCLMSTNQAFVPFFGGSSGVLCLGAPIVRFNLEPQGKVLFSGESGVMDFSPDLKNLPQGVVFRPGESWNFQVWFRDVVGGMFTSNTSDAVTVTWQ